MPGDPWSPDSTTVAVVERVVQTGKKYVAVIPLSRQARRIPLPDSAAATELQWLGLSTRMRSELRAREALEKMRLAAADRFNVSPRSTKSDVWIAH